MNTIKHTPGPWRIMASITGEAATCWVVGRKESKSFADLSDQDVIAAVTSEGKSNDADARLIAAAPDMLAVLQELAESADYWSEYDVPLGIVDRINAAIAKAVSP
jgi:hypothetical protein